MSKISFRKFQTSTSVHAAGSLRNLTISDRRWLSIASSDMFARFGRIPSIHVSLSNFVFILTLPQSSRVGNCYFSNLFLSFSYKARSAFSLLARRTPARFAVLASVSAILASASLISLRSSSVGTGTFPQDRDRCLRRMIFHCSSDHDGLTETWYTSP